MILLKNVDICKHNIEIYFHMSARREKITTEQAPLSTHDRSRQTFCFMAPSASLCNSRFCWFYSATESHTFNPLQIQTWVPENGPGPCQPPVSAAGTNPPAPFAKEPCMSKQPRPLLKRSQCVQGKEGSSTEITL